MSRQTWNWRAELTPAERAAIASYDDAMEKVRAAQAEADKHRLLFTRIMNRCVQRARFQAGATR